MKKHLLLLLLSLFILQIQFSIYAEECDYSAIKYEIEKQGFVVRKSTNYYHNFTKEEITEYAERLNIPREYMRLSILHNIEYSFKQKVLNLNSGLYQFTLLRYDSEQDAKEVELNEKKNLKHSIDGSKEILNITGHNTSQFNIERINNYNVILLYGKDVKKRADPILDKIRECTNFDFENFFSKSTLAKTIDDSDSQVVPPFRDKLKELAATHDAMYTSELKTENSLNKHIKLISKKYVFQDKYNLNDLLELKKVVLELENYSTKSFFSVDVFVVYYDKQKEIIDATRSISYSVNANTKFNVESFPSRYNSTHATSAYVFFTISNMVTTNTDELVQATPFEKSKKRSYKEAKAFAIQYVKDNSKDKKIVYDAVYVSSDAFQYADETLKKDKEFVISIMQQDGLLWSKIDDSLKKDPDVIQAVIKELILALYAGVSLGSVREKKVTSNKAFLASVMDYFVIDEKDEVKKRQKIKEVVLATVKNKGTALMYSDDFTGDEEIVLAALSNNAHAFEYIDYEFSSNRKVMMAAVSKDGYLLEEADGILKKDKKLVLAAVKETGGFAFEFADDVLKEDREFSLKAIKSGGHAYKYIHSQFKDDRDFAISAVRNSGYVLGLLSPRLQKDKELVRAAVKNTPSLFKNIDKSLKDDKEFVKSLDLMR